MWCVFVFLFAVVSKMNLEVDLIDDNPGQENDIEDEEEDTMHLGQSEFGDQNADHEQYQCQATNQHTIGNAFRCNGLCDTRSDDD